MNAYDVNIDETDSVINIISKRVLPEKTVEELLNRRSINKNIYKEFRLEQIKGHKTTWDYMKKNNLPTHTVSIKITKVKLQNCVIVLKRDRKLMVCFLIASRKRSKLNPEKQIGLWEFSMVPTIFWEPFWEPYFHNILRLFDILPDFPFTTSETMGEYLRDAPRVAERLKT